MSLLLPLRSDTRWGTIAVELMALSQAMRRTLNVFCSWKLFVVADLRQWMRELLHHAAAHGPTNQLHTQGLLSTAVHKPTSIPETSHTCPLVVVLRFCSFMF
jgi:hypothetical protein